MNGVWWVREDDLTNEQKKAVDSIPIDQSYLVVGAPGSGKTNVLLLRSKYLRAKGKVRIRFVTFTATLRSFVRLGGTQYKINPKEVVTSAQLFADILLDNARSVARNEGENFIAYRKRLAIETGELLDQYPKLTGIFDVLLIDEIQDYTAEEVQVMYRLSKVVIAAGDENQRIYEIDGALQKFEELVKQKINLPRHFRNGKKICLVADAILVNSGVAHNMYACANYDETLMPSSVGKMICDDLSQQISKIIEEIEIQLRAYPGELIGVLFPKNVEVDQFCHQAKENGKFEKILYRVKDEDDCWTSEKRIIVSTMHSSKGLEFRAVHLGGCETISQAGWKNQKRLAFTAVTRAKTSLQLYWSGSVPAYLSDAIQKAEGEIKDVTIGSLFS